MLLEMRVFGLAIDPVTNAPIVVLKDTEDKNTLPIWIGILEASAIATELEKIKLARPMTHDLLKEILKTLAVTVSRVEVNDLRGNVYYATIHLSMDDRHYALDARPSDAIALALRTDSSIFVDEKVLEKSKNIDLRKGGDKGKEGDSWLDILENLSPEDFGKYKM
ncbi:MAG: bifunctional nuclease family protein [Deltaproteobacteria bacterium]|nr:bifunctional nuclease family protein [Deltaproteobacteria bacterium]